MRELTEAISNMLIIGLVVATVFLVCVIAYNYIDDHLKGGGI